MHYTRDQIQGMDRIDRLNLINSVSGIKPANLIGSIDEKERTNLAIFSSVVHLGSDPALLGFICRPRNAGTGHTLNNIERTGVYTINHVHPHFTRQAHLSSAKFPLEVSEFDPCRLRAEFIEGFAAPFVSESRIKIGLRHVESIPIELNETTLVIGEIMHLILPDESVSDSGIDLEKTYAVGISGLNRYYRVENFAEYPYVGQGDPSKATGFL